MHSLCLWHWFTGLFYSWNMITWTKLANKTPATLKPKMCSATDSTDVRNLPALAENKGGALAVEMIKSLPLWWFGKESKVIGVGCFVICKEVCVQLFTVIICGLGYLWAIKPHLFLSRSMGLFLLRLSTVG